MTSFRTELAISPQPNKLSVKSNVLTAGSCFAEVMGNKIETYKVKSLVNPFGTIFNPLSLFKILAAAIEPEKEFNGKLLERDGLWYAYDLHSSFTASTPELLKKNIQERLVQTHDFLKNTNLLVLTLGTAVGYIHKASNLLVANCHKVPQQQFRKEIISTASIIDAFKPLYRSLQEFNPHIKILFTVSPVRHLKETLELNSVSKSVLRVACYEISRQFPEVGYFPAYELLLDDLRDYRFYKADMIHPTEVAEDYIWEKFKVAYFDNAFQAFTRQWDQIVQALAHKPFQPASAAHQQFLKNLLTQLEQLSTQVNCSAEIDRVKSQII